MVNYLGLLGLGGHGQGEEIYSLDDLVGLFSTAHLVKKSAIFDFGKLNFLNAHYIRSKDALTLRNLAVPFLEKAGFRWESETWLAEALDLFKGNAVTLKDFALQFRTAFRAVPIVCAEAVEKAKAIPGAETAIQALAESLRASFPKDANEAQSSLKSAQAAAGIKGKSFFMPVRLALMDSEHGPELNRLLPLIGREKCLARLDVFTGILR